MCVCVYIHLYWKKCSGWTSICQLFLIWLSRFCACTNTWHGLQWKVKLIECQLTRGRSNHQMFSGHALPQYEATGISGARPDCTADSWNRLKVSWWLEPIWCPSVNFFNLGPRIFREKLQPTKQTRIARRKWMSAPKRIWIRRIEGTLHWEDVELSGLRGLYYSKTPCSYVEYIVVLSVVVFFV